MMVMSKVTIGHNVGSGNSKEATCAVTFKKGSPSAVRQFHLAFAPRFLEGFNRPNTSSQTTFVQ
jgi:hypothetical protein